MWTHNYEPLGGSLALSAPVAALPIVVLFLMLGVWRAPAWKAALSGLVTAFLVASGVYGMPVGLAAISTVYGAAYGIFPIAWIVFSSIMLYRLAVDTGKFEVIKDSVGSLTDDRRLQAMFIAFSFGAFIEGAAGFGAPVAVSGAMLAGLGFNPFYAAGICLLANTAPVAFGSIGIPVTTLAAVTGLPVLQLSAMVGRMRESRADLERFRRRSRALLEWRGLPEVPNPGRNQHATAALVPKLLAKLGLAGRLRDEDIAAAWHAIAGEFAARFSHPQKLRHRTLVVAVSQPAVLWTLDRSKSTLLARLQEKFGKDVIRELRFQAG